MTNLYIACYRWKILIQVILLFLFISLISTVIKGQSESVIDRETITMNTDSLWLEGYRLFNQHKFQEAIQSYKAALNSAPTLVDSLICYNYIALQYKSLQQLDSAVYYLDKVTIIDPNTFQSNKAKMRVVRANFLRHKIHYFNGEYEAAVSRLNQALTYLVQDSIENYERVNYRIDLAQMYSVLGDIELAKQESHRASAEIASINISELQRKKLSVKNNGNLGTYYFKTGNPERATNYLKLVLSDTTFLDAYDNEAYYTFYKTMGDIYLDKTLIDSSIYYYHRALKRSTKDDNPGRVILRPYIRSSILSNLGEAYVHKGDFQRAEEYYTKGYNISLANYNNDISWLTQHIQNLSKINNIKGNYAISIQYAKEAIELSREIYGTRNNFSHSHDYNFLGRIFIDQKSYDKAIIYSDSALISNSKISFKNKEVYVQEFDFFESVYIKLLGLKGERAFISDNEVLDVLFKIFKNQINSRDVNYGLNSTSKTIENIYNVFYNSYNELYLLTSNEIFLKKLWEISELNKARELMSQISLKNLAIKQLPLDEKAKEKSIRDSIVHYTNKYAHQSSNESDTLLNLKERRYNLLNQVSKNSIVTALLNQELQLDLKLYKEEMPTNSATLCFYEGEKKIHAMYISSDTIKTKSFDRNILTQLIINLKKELNEGSVTYRYNEELRDSLIESFSISDNIETLEIIPEGIIWDINFGALKQPNKLNEQNSLTFLGIEKNIIYQFSDNLKTLQENYQVNDKNSVLGISYAAATETISRFRSFGILGDLPGTRKEVSSISEDWDGNYFYDGISETEFVNIAHEYNILHIALHSVLDTLRPALSSLIFSKKDSLNDGRLFSFEVENLDLNVNMAVLSACQSGNGKIRNGEGIMSMARSFAIGGSKSIVSSKWDVSDFSSPIIMKHFYEGLKRGMTKSASLKEAQKYYLQNHADNMTSHLKYWSSFFIIGDDLPIANKSFFSYPTLFAGILFLSFLLFYKLKISPKIKL